MAEIRIFQHPVKGCNNGECDILNIDGSQTGISKVPLSLRLFRVFQNQKLFSAQSNGISTFFFDGKKIGIPDAFLNPKIMLENSKICKDSLVLENKKQPKLNRRNFLYSPNHVVHTACYDLTSHETSILPYQFTSSSFGMGIFDGGYSRNGYGYLFIKGRIYDSLKNCVEAKFLDGSFGIQCSRPHQKVAPWNDVTFDSNGKILPSNFGAIYDKYRGLTFSINRDEFGTDSTIVSLNNVRVFGHSFFKPVPFYNGRGFCNTNFENRKTACYNLEDNKQFQIGFGVYRSIAIIGANYTDTIGFDDEGRLSAFSEKFFQRTRKYSGVWYGSDHGFIVSSAGNSFNSKPALISIKIDRNDSFIVDKFIPNDGGRIERVGKYYVVGVD